MKGSAAQALDRETAMRMGKLGRCAIGALVALLGTESFAGTTDAFTYRAQQYPGSRERQYKVYRPDGLTGPAPMVMALHGCQQSEADVLRDWGLTAAADRHRFILVTPFITSYDGLRNQNCWGFWFDQHRHEGRGEPEDLHGIARAVESRFAVDPQRRYITGLSSGAAMAVVAAVTHNEYWAAVASVAGIPYGEDSASVSLSGQCPGFASFHPVSRVGTDMRAELDDTYRIPLLAVQNERDCTVVQPAGRNLRDAHLAVFGEPGHNTTTTALAREGACSPVFQADYACRHSVYTRDGTSASRSVVETLFYDGPTATPDPSDTDHGHYWIGGEDGRDGRWSMRRGPSLPDIVWNFFERHPRSEGPVSGGPRITVTGDNPLRLNVGERFVDPGATAIDPEDGVLQVAADCSGVDSSRAGTYVCTYTATDSAGNAASATRGVEVVDEGGAGAECPHVTATPQRHVLAGRAVSRGWFGGAYATGDGRFIGFGWNVWSDVTLYQGQPGEWFATLPEGCSP